MIANKNMIKVHFEHIPLNRYSSCSKGRKSLAHVIVGYLGETAKSNVGRHKLLFKNTFLLELVQL